MKEIDDININEINNASKKVPAGRHQKVEISGETALFLDVFHKRAGAARGMSDSPEYVQFYETLKKLKDIAEYIVSNRKAEKIFKEEAAYKRYVKTVNQLKKDAKAYETYKLSEKTENPKGEAGKKKVNSKDKEKLSIVRAVMNNKYRYFKVPAPAKTEEQKIREELVKADEALARLKEGKYEKDPDNKKMLNDAAVALIGQMVRISGGAVLIDRNTGKKISYSSFRNRCIQDRIEIVFKNKQTGEFYTPDRIYKACIWPPFLDNVIKVSMKSDAGKKRSEEALPMGDEAKKVMLLSFAEDMEKMMLSISGTYGKGRSDSSPSRVMTSVLKNMRNFSKKNGKTADTPEGRQKAMMKLSPKEFRDRIDQLEKSIDNYLEKRPYPSKADRIERQQHLITLRHKLASYKKELTAIENGKPGFIHKPKIGLERKGNSISYADLKKELLKFIFDMANKAREGRTFLRDYDPETYRIANPEGNRCPPEPEPKLAAFFDAMKDFKNIFLTDDKDNVPKISFDIIKEKVENVYKTGMIYKASLKGKNEDNVLKYYMNSMTDIWHDCLDNIDKLQPYMDMETPEGRIGSKNIYDVTKTMVPPYNKLLLVGSEFDMMTPKFINKQMSKQALDSWRESIDALDKEKLLQKRIKKTWAVRDRVLLYDSNNAATDLYINPAGPELPPNVREERKKEMMKTVAKHIFCELADKEDMWMEISNTVTTDGNPVSRYLYEELADKVLENNQAFLNVHESSTYFNVGERVVAEAKRLGTFEQIKEAFNPAGIIQHIKVAEAEKNKTVETAPVTMKK